MSKKNLTFTKDGVRVGVKQRNTENYVDATQSWVVKAWNLGTASNEEQQAKNGYGFLFFSLSPLRGHRMQRIFPPSMRC